MEMPMRFWLAVLLCGGLAGLSAAAQTPTPPKTWVDKDTGHRIYRVSDEPGSSGFYFNVNAYSKDGKTMVYTAPDGIHTLELATRKTRLLVPNPTVPEGASQQDRLRAGNHAIVVGHKTNSVFFSRTDEATHRQVIYKADLTTGEVTRLIMLPERSTICATSSGVLISIQVFMLQI